MWAVPPAIGTMWDSEPAMAISGCPLAARARNAVRTAVRLMSSKRSA
jgi:hypothetical protein